jgi:hypothetical protein
MGTPASFQDGEILLKAVGNGVSDWHSAKVQVARCLYCGSLGVWWECHCRASVEAQEGRRPKPKVLVRDGKTIIVVDAETAARNALGMKRYGAVTETVNGNGHRNGDFGQNRNGEEVIGTSWFTDTVRCDGFGNHGSAFASPFRSQDSIERPTRRVQLSIFIRETGRRLERPISRTRRGPPVPQQLRPAASLRSAAEIFTGRDSA